MFVFQKIAEKRIKEAQKRGDFDDLPGHGEPINIEDDRNIPEDLRLVHKILKNADCLPPELQLRKDIRQMEDMLDNIPDEKEKYRPNQEDQFQDNAIEYDGERFSSHGGDRDLLQEAT